MDKDPLQFRFCFCFLFYAQINEIFCTIDVMFLV